MAHIFMLFFVCAIAKVCMDLLRSRILFRMNELERGYAKQYAAHEISLYPCIL